MDFFVIVVMMLESISAFGLVAFCCETGQRCSNKFDDVCDAIYKLNWHLYPIEVQQLLPITMLVAQQEVAVECFGSVLCLRESFKGVSITLAYKYQF